MPPTTPKSSRLEPDGRCRQSRRDEQLRRKLETEIGRRRSKVGYTPQTKKHQRGSVMTLKPLPPLTMAQDTSVVDAAQYMSAHRANCALVVDDEGAVCGIFTAKDLAFKVVGSGRDRRTMVVSDVMTPSPECADIDASATDALNMMVSRGFRHLPVMDSDGEIAGVLDITRCYFEAMQKLERAYESSRKLHDALEGVQNELGSSQPVQFLQYVQALRQHAAGPDLASVLDGRPPIFVDVRTTVAEAAMLMKEHGTTAVLVTDKSTIAGIFTSKDVVLRVLSAGIEPTRCSVVRVMTPQPDSAPSTMSIQDALRKMHEGHYLNLPVTDAEGQVSGVVNVLRLTYAILEQINSISSEQSSTSDGPAWNKFWMSLDDDTDSVTSASTADELTLAGTGSNSGVNDTMMSENELAEFQIPDPAEGIHFDFEGRGLVEPEDSASRVGDRNSDEYSKPIIEEDTFAATFKFKAPNGRAHRINVTQATTLDEFRGLVAAKLVPADLEPLGEFAASYLDDDNDLISITTKEDIAEAASVAGRQGNGKTDIYIHHPDKTPEIELAKTFDPADYAMPLIIGGSALLIGGLFALQRSR